MEKIVRVREAVLPFCHLGVTWKALLQNKAALVQVLPIIQCLFCEALIEHFFAPPNSGGPNWSKAKTNCWSKPFFGPQVDISMG